MPVVVLGFVVSGYGKKICVPLELENFSNKIFSLFPNLSDCFSLPEIYSLSSCFLATAILASCEFMKGYLNSKVDYKKLLNTKRDKIIGIQVFAYLQVAGAILTAHSAIVTAYSISAFLALMGIVSVGLFFALAFVHLLCMPKNYEKIPHHLKISVRSAEGCNIYDIKVENE